MRSPQFNEVLGRSVVPELDKRYPNRSGISEHNIAPCHASKMVKKFMTEKNIPMLDWPGSSPDVNPNDNL